MRTIEQIKADIKIVEADMHECRKLRCYLPVLEDDLDELYEELKQAQALQKSKTRSKK